MPTDREFERLASTPAGGRSGRRLLLPVAGSLVLIVAFAVGTLWLLTRQFQTIASERAAVAHSRELIDELDTLLRWLREAHAAKRAFIMSSRSASIATTVDLYRREGASSPAIQQMLDTAKQNIIETQTAIQRKRERETELPMARIKSGDEELQDAHSVAIYALLAACVFILLVGAGMLRHIRRREQLEKQFKESSTLWRAIIDSIDQGVSVYDRELRLLDWNRRYCELRGVQPEQLFVGASIEHIHHMGMPSMTGTPQDSAAWQRERLSQVVRESRADVREWRRADGVGIQSSARPMSNGLSVVTLTDISMLRASEAAVRDQAARLAAIFDNVLDAIITFDENGSIESWSRGAERMFGYSAADIRQRDVASLLAPPCDEELRGYLRDSEALAAGKRLELEAARQEGGRFAIDLCVSEMYLGLRRLFVCVIRDISERRELERMKSEFVSTVSHELRTPLTSIAGALGLVTAGVAGELPEKAARLLAIAQRNSERLTLLINDILDLEKTEAGKLALRMRVQPLRPIVEQAIEANRVFAEGLGVRYELVISDDQGKACVDCERLVQVLTNLLSNATKFSLSQAVVRVVLERVGPMLRVAVHDDGPGIAPSFRDKVFTRFAQADASDARRRGGTGLGLAIAKSLTESQGGRIGFASGESAVGGGQGATFWVEFPALGETETRPLSAQVMLAPEASLAAWVANDAARGSKGPAQEHG